MTTLADAWKAGDAPTVERIVLQELRKEPGMYQRLLVDRNKDWLPKIEALFARKGRTFVVVGAAHLVGSDGLLAMLKAKGYGDRAALVSLPFDVRAMKPTLLTALLLTAAVGSFLRKQRSIDEFFAAFTAEWLRLNPNQAASIRFFTGEEQRQFERQLTPVTREWRQRRAALAARGLKELRTFDRARLNDTQRISAELMEWQLDTVTRQNRTADYFFPFEQNGGVNVGLVGALTVNHPIAVRG